MYFLQSHLALVSGYGTTASCVRVVESRPKRKNAAHRLSQASRQSVAVRPRHGHSFQGRPLIRRL